MGFLNTIPNDSCLQVLELKTYKAIIGCSISIQALQNVSNEQSTAVVSSLIVCPIAKIFSPSIRNSNTTQWVSTSFSKHITHCSEHFEPYCSYTFQHNHHHHHHGPCRSSLRHEFGRQLDSRRLVLFLPNETRFQATRNHRTRYSKGCSRRDPFSKLRLDEVP